MLLTARIFLLFVASATAVFCDTVNLGVITFDILIPAGGGTTGVNVFNISNFTGDPLLSGFALPPDFPVFSSVLFLDSTLTLDDGGGPLPGINLGAIDVGPFASPGSLQFPDTTAFTSAIFSATLNQTSLLLADGTTFLADSSSILATIVPGGPLVPGLEFAIISVSGTIASEVPEPQTVLLVLGALSALAAFARIRRVAA